ncbi:MAG: DNA cytosine methyltransferase [Alcaligenes pakistanensis]
MRFLSVCSGIEAASVAWNPLGWKAVAFSEIEPFPCAVLAHHYPDIPNWGDMTKFQEWPDEPIDLLCGGTPCQSFSVAGLRKGLDDPRGDLMLTFGAIAAKYRPKWLVWENVPGVLSSNGGRDFGTFLGMLGQLGYGFAYRVLDAQYFGVPQRRRRVFVVGCLGDWRSAAAVLFEQHSLSGNPAPSRKTGQGTATDIAPSLVSSGRGVDRIGETRGQDPVIAVDSDLIAKTLLSGGHSNNPLDETLLAFDTTQITNTANYSSPKPGDPCHPLAAGAHAPAIAFDCKSSGQNGFGIGIEIAGTQRAMASTSSHQNGGGHQAIAYAVRTANTSANGHGISNDIAHTLDQAQGQAVAFAQNSRDELREMPYVGALSAEPGMKQTSYIRSAMQVRRLTPEECEALQAFPLNYTRIPWRKKPAERCPDGPRYKALGNSWCVNNVRWIGERIEQVNRILESR